MNTTRCQSTVTSLSFLAGQFNLAIKMLFNYGIQSNAEALEKAMDKELLPLRRCSDHPNVVRMYSCFVDSFPLLKEAHEYYPMAIPTHLSSEGFGRNKTLFIVMRRYDLTLSEYLRLNKPSEHERLQLLAQLLEALLYLQRHSIVHRDLKSDNLLVSSSTAELVLADFGCALYQPPNLKMPYTTDEIGKGGNLALMAPEVSVFLYCDARLSRPTFPLSQCIEQLIVYVYSCQSRSRRKTTPNRFAR
jgi:PTEN induced putative kinase 1